jgi:tetratricopeptide (TPR) repeat protein
VTGLGALDSAVTADVFSSVEGLPSMPASRRKPLASTVDRGHIRPNEGAVASAISDLSEQTVASARRQVDRLRTTTTLAALASAYEAAGETDLAVRTATDVLSDPTAALVDVGGESIDAASLRLALEILLRSGAIDLAAERAARLPAANDTKLVIASALGSSGRPNEGLALVEDMHAPGAAAVRGFLLAAAEKYTAAIPELRHALRNEPDDVDSAFNLSISLWKVGSREKATRVALRATRSAPSRADISLHFLELLLDQGRNEAVRAEIARLRQRGVEPSARLIVMEARAVLSQGEHRRAVALLEQASEFARRENDDDAAAEIEGNLIRLRFNLDLTDRAVAIQKLLNLRTRFPKSDVVAVSLAQVANRRQHAKYLTAALEDVRSTTVKERIHLLEHCIAVLNGDNLAAAETSLQWLEAAPNDPFAASAAVVALGIGSERWQEAAQIASSIVARGDADQSSLNNAAYVLAMAGRAHEAIDVLEPYREVNYVLRATLGLAYLAAGDLKAGMKLYREAAEDAERKDRESRSLMTAYQALVVAQLGLRKSTDPEMIAALSLPPVSLPDDWRDRPDFLRLRNLASQKGWNWPLAL